MTRTTMQFFQTFATCEETGCRAPVHSRVRGPEEADYLFCEPHGTAFVAKMRAWEAAEDGRKRGERFRLAEYLASNANYVARALFARATAQALPSPPATDNAAHRPPAIYVTRRRSVDAGGDAYGMCDLCEADHRGDYEVLFLSASGTLVAYATICAARLSDLDRAVEHAWNEPMV